MVLVNFAAKTKGKSGLVQSRWVEDTLWIWSTDYHWDYGVDELERAPDIRQTGCINPRSTEVKQRFDRRHTGRQSCCIANKVNGTADFKL